MHGSPIRAMDTDWRPMQGSNPPAGVDPNTPDWRVQLQPQARSWIVSRIVKTLKKHPPVSRPVGLNELQRNAVRFEEEIYTAATSQSDYWREISLKMLSIETKTGQAPGNAQAIPDQNNPGQASADSTAQTGHTGVGDWQEEIYQMIKSLKGKYFAELSELFNKISVKLDSIIPPQRPSELYERMKGFKIMLDRILEFLQTSKSTIQPVMRDKVLQYEKVIINIFDAKRRKPVQPQVQQQFQQPAAGQAPNSDISQQRQPSQSSQQHYSHTNPQASLSSMSTGLQSSSAANIQNPTTILSVPTHQNGAKRQRKADSYLQAARGSSSDSVLMVQSSMSAAALQQGSTGPM